MARRSTRGIEAIATLQDRARRRLYEYVIEQGRPVSRNQAATALRMSRSAAAFHLDRLADVGLLKTEFRRLSGRTGAGAGRPAKLYRRSEREFSVSLPRREHELLASFLAEVVDVRSDQIVRISPAREFGIALGSRARRRLRGRPSDEGLLRCVETVLDHIGFFPTPRAGIDLWMRECPFDPLSGRFPQVVCGAGVSLVEGIIDGVGASGVRVSREPDDERCCVHLAWEGSEPRA